MAMKKVYFCDQCGAELISRQDRPNGIRVSGMAPEWSGTVRRMADRGISIRACCHAISTSTIGGQEFEGNGDRDVEMSFAAAHDGGLLFCGTGCLRAWFNQGIDVIESAWLHAQTASAENLQAAINFANAQTAANMGPSENNYGANVMSNLAESLEEIPGPRVL